MSEKEDREHTRTCKTPRPQQTEVVVDDSGTLPSYSNFCRVTATPEEVILDFGLNPQPFATGRQDVKANQRIVMNFYTAKRLLTALGMTIQRHEGTFGSIELDVRRRATARLSTRSPAGLAPRASSSKTDSGSVTAPLRRGVSLEREPETSPGDQGKANPAELLGHLAPSWLFSHPIASHHRLSVPLEFAKPLGWLVPTMTRLRICGGFG